MSNGIFLELMQAGMQERHREAAELERQHRARVSQQPELRERPRSGLSGKGRAQLPVLALMPRRSN